MRVFPAAPAVRVELRIEAAQANARLEIDLCDAAGRRPVRLVLGENGTIQTADGGNMVTVGKYKPAAEMKLSVIDRSHSGQIHCAG